MSYVFGKAFVCKDAATARAVAFDKEAGLYHSHRADLVYRHTKHPQGPIVCSHAPRVCTLDSRALTEVDARVFYWW